MAESTLNGQEFSERITQIIEANLQNEQFGELSRWRMKRACKILTPKKMINPDTYRDMRVPYYTFKNKQY